MPNFNNEHQEVKRRIMIVDDEPYNILGMETMLKQTGFSNEIVKVIDKAFNGAEALKLVKRAHYNYKD